MYIKRGENPLETIAFTWECYSPHHSIIKKVSMVTNYKVQTNGYKE